MEVKYPLSRTATPLQASQMHFRNGQAQGFALFATTSAARLAVELVCGTQFDDGASLRAEMARKNMYLKVRRQGGG